MRLLQRLQLFFLCAILVHTGLHAQKIKIDDSLRLNSETLELKTRGGFSSIFKFNFGEYAVISGKGGWQSSSREARLFSVNEVSEAKRKYSFVFVSKDRDTARVNAATNTIIDINDPARAPFQTMGNVDFARIVGSKANFIATINIPGDSSIWTLVMVQKGGQSIDPSSAFAFEGGLTDGETKYDLHQLREWTGGKGPMMNFGIPGYELFKEGKPVAAIQAPFNTVQKKYVWIRNDLDSPTRFLVATAMAALAENVLMELQ